jgi:hypothetical protein
MCTLPGSVYSSNFSYTQAAVWMNGNPEIVPTTQYAFANAVAVINGNLHVVGQQLGNNQLPTPVVWLNGLPPC